MTDLNPERLAELRRIAEAATPGPWEWDKYLHLFSATGKPVLTKPFSPDNPDVVEARPEDLDYIERFDPATALALLDRIEALEQERDAARAEAERWKQQYEALRAEVESVAQELRKRAYSCAKDWLETGHHYHDGASDAYYEAGLMVRRLLAEAGGDA